MNRRLFLKYTLAAPILLNLACKPEDAAVLKLHPQSENHFEFLKVSGSYKEIGIQIGRHFRANINEVINKKSEWIKELLAVTRSESGGLYANKLKIAARRKFPHFVDELEGMAFGSGIELEIIWTLSLISELKSFTDEEPGCSTIFYKDDKHTWLFHNEDGDKVYKDNLFVLKVEPLSGVSFITLAYPGIISGVGPSLNSKGIAHTTNFIGCLKPKIGIPRFFLGRAVLEAKTLADALMIVSSKPRAFPWHHNFLDIYSGTYASIETLPEGTIDVSYPGKGIKIHTNHALGAKTKDYKYQDLDYKTLSSDSRMEALQKSISNYKPPLIHPVQALKWLSSHANSPYSPCRHPVDDIKGQTLATAFFDIESKKMRIYKGNPCKSVKNQNYQDYSF